MKRRLVLLSCLLMFAASLAVAQTRPKAILKMRNAQWGHQGFRGNDTIGPDTCYIEFNPNEWEIADKNIMLIRGARPVQVVRGSGNGINMRSVTSHAENGDRLMIEIKSVKSVNGGNPKKFNKIFMVPLNQAKNQSDKSFMEGLPAK